VKSPIYGGLGAVWAPDPLFRYFIILSERFGGGLEEKVWFGVIMRSERLRAKQPRIQGPLVQGSPELPPEHVYYGVPVTHGYYSRKPAVPLQALPSTDIRGFVNRLSHVLPIFSGNLDAKNMPSFEDLRIAMMGHLETSGLKKETDGSMTPIQVIEQVPQFNDV